MTTAIARRYVVVLKPTAYEDEVGYTVNVPSLPGRITEGDRIEEAPEDARAAISAYFETLENRGMPVPPADEVVMSVEVRTAD